MKKPKTPIEKILFRSSKIGLLAGGLIRNDLTEKQAERKAELEATELQFVGLTSTQQAKLDSLEAKVNSGGKITDKQTEELNDLKLRLTTLKELTPNQKEELQALQLKDGAEPSLSVGAKTYIKEVWLWYEKGFKEEISSKQTRKGNQAEEDAINLISFVDGFLYTNNNKKPNKGRVQKGHLTGACDVDTYFEVIEKKVIDDIKCSWNPKTFMSTTYSTLEEWQGRAYLHLYDADIFRLRRCLVDCPPEVLQDELKKYCWSNNIIDPTSIEYKEEIDQFYNNFLYEKTGLYTQEERVKTFAFARCEKLEAVLLKSIELGVEYYKTITLNMID